MIDSAYIDTLQVHLTSQYFITKISGLGKPTPRADRSDRAQRHGQIDYTRYYSGRVIAVEGVCVGTSIANAWDLFDTLKAAFVLGSSHTFKFMRTGRTYSDQCVVTVESELKEEISTPSRVISWSAVLLAGDPRLYSDILKSASYDPSLAGSGGGINFNFSGGVALGVTLVGGVTFAGTTITHLDLTNAGQFSTPVKYTIQGPVINPTIDNDTTIQSLYIIYNLGVNDTVVIDTSDRSILLNGASRPDLLDVQNTTWFDLIPGLNSLRLRGTGMVTGQTLFTAQFRDARI